MKLRKKAVVWILAGVMVVSSVQFPISRVQAEEITTKNENISAETKEVQENIPEEMTEESVHETKQVATETEIDDFSTQNESEFESSLETKETQEETIENYLQETEQVATEIEENEADNVLTAEENTSANIEDNLLSEDNSKDDEQISKEGVVLQVPECVDGIYQISTIGELYWFAGLVNGTLSGDIVQNTNANAILKNDIVINDTNYKIKWTPIGNIDNVYTGIFDGNSNEISGLYYEDSYSCYSYRGFFGKSDGVIKNIKLTNSKDKFNCAQTTETRYIGGVCGYNSGVIENVIFDGKIYGKTTNNQCVGYVGGICGYNTGYIKNSHNLGEIEADTESLANATGTKGYTYCGGIAGINEGDISNSSNIGAITGNTYARYYPFTYVGGICGMNSGNLLGNVNKGKIWGKHSRAGKGSTSIYCDVGGVCGLNNSGLIKECFNIGEVSGSGYEDVYFGGICGYNKDATIKYCYNKGMVKGHRYAGGICAINCGSNIADAIVEDCYNKGNIQGSWRDGYAGICGINQVKDYNDGAGNAIVRNCYSSGIVNDYNNNLDYDTAGVCGKNYGGYQNESSISMIKNCYYLEGTANVAIAYNNNATFLYVEEKDKDSFVSGSVCELLNNESSDNNVWCQNLGEDMFPMLNTNIEENNVSSFELELSTKGVVDGEISILGNLHIFEQENVSVGLLLSEINNIIWYSNDIDIVDSADITCSGDIASDNCSAVLSVYFLPKKAGTVTITGTTSNGITASCEVTITEGGAGSGIVSDFTLDSTVSGTLDDTINIFGNLKLSADAEVSSDILQEEIDNIKWTTSDSAIAKVTKCEGIKSVDNRSAKLMISVTPYKAGTVTITGESSNGIIKNCELVVEPKMVLESDNLNSNTERKITCTITNNVPDANYLKNFMENITYKWTDSATALTFVSSNYEISTDKKSAVYTLTVLPAENNSKTTITFTSQGGIEEKITKPVDVWSSWGFGNYAVNTVPVTEEFYEKYWAGLDAIDRRALHSLIAIRHDGQCHGMAVMALLVDQGVILLNTIEKNTETLYNIARNKEAEKLIGWYHLSQFNCDYWGSTKIFKKFKVARQLEIISQIESPFLLSYGAFGKGAHAVVGYMIETGTWEKHGHLYNQRVITYDPNFPHGSNEDEYLYFDVSVGQWEVPIYYDSHNSSSYNGGYLGGAVTNLEILSSLDFTNLASLNGNESSTWLRSNNNAAFTIKTGNSSYEIGNKDYSSYDNIFVTYDDCFNLDMPDQVPITNVYLEGNSKISIIPDKATDALDYGILYNNTSYIDTKVSSYESAEFSKEGTVKLSGIAGEYDIDLTYDDSLFSNSSIKISGNGATEVSAETTAEGIIVQGDNLQDVNVTVYDVNDDTAEIKVQVSSSKDSILIEEEDKKIIVSEDSNGDGIYDKKIADSSGEIIEDKASYKVSFDTQIQGSVLTTYTDIEEGSTIVPPTEPTAEGYTFTGWYKDADCTILWDFATDVVTSDMILYAGWKESEKEVYYLVTFVMHKNETIIWPSIRVQSGSVVTPPEEPTEEGYIFTGWYKDANCTELWDFNKDIVTSDVTLYAGWKANEESDDKVKYTVIFNTQNHGTAPKPYKNIEANSIITPPEEPSAKGYIFTGWYKDANCTILWDFNKDIVTSDLTLYAGWKRTGNEPENPSNPNKPVIGDVLPEDIPTDGKIPDGLWIAGVKDCTYTGKIIKPEVRVYDSDKLLKAGQDYTISYKNNTKANDASVESKAPAVVIKGKGNYTGTEKQTFKILPLDINDTSITAEDITVAYNKKMQKKVPVVTYNGKKLANNKDFTVSYPDKETEAYKAAGTYNILLTAKQGGNFTGTRTVKFTITNNTLISSATVKKIPNQTYTGKVIEPELEVTMKKSPLKKNTDYTVTYANNIEAGTATAILTGIGKYAGTKKVTFKITGTPLKGAVISGITDRVYNGEAQEQKITVTLNNKTLTEKQDYEIVYSQNTKAGKATVSIKGINAYSGTVRKNFNITAYNMEGNAEKLIGGLEKTITAKYVKGGSTPKPELTFAGKKLIEGTDYTVFYKNNKVITAADTKNKPTITIKGKGNFKGTLTKTFTITGKALNDAESPVTLTVADKGFVDKAGKYISAPVLTDADGKKLAAGKDYESAVVYTLEDGTELTKNSKVNAGTKIKVKVTGKGAYSGELEGVYQITQNDFNKAKISISPQTYTGKAVTLNKDSVVVKIGKETLVFGTDYEIVENSYANNVKRGTASVTIVGKGNYGGTKTVKFKIKAKKFLWFSRIFG